MHSTAILSPAIVNSSLAYPAVVSLPQFHRPGRTAVQREHRLNQLVNLARECHAVTWWVLGSDQREMVFRRFYPRLVHQARRLAKLEAAREVERIARRDRQDEREQRRHDWLYATLARSTPPRPAPPRPSPPRPAPQPAPQPRPAAGLLIPPLVVPTAEDDQNRTCIPNRWCDACRRHGNAHCIPAPRERRCCRECGRPDGEIRLIRLGLCGDCVRDLGALARQRDQPRSRPAPSRPVVPPPPPAPPVPVVPCLSRDVSGSDALGRWYLEHRLLAQSCYQAAIDAGCPGDLLLWVQPRAGRPDEPPSSATIYSLSRARHVLTLREPAIGATLGQPLPPGQFWVAVTPANHRLPGAHLGHELIHPSTAELPTALPLRYSGRMIVTTTPRPGATPQTRPVLANCSVR